MLNRIKDIIYNLIGWMARIGSRKIHANKVLIIRVDEIGDYMLWRPFISGLCNWQRLTGMEITLCGNNSWRSLYEQLDDELFGSTIWLDKSQFKSDIFYRFQFLKKVYKEGFRIVINPTYSRDKRNDDAIVKAAKALENIGMLPNKENCRPYDEGYDEDLYTNTWEGPTTPLFELKRNCLFTEHVTGKSIKHIQWQIPEAKLPALSIALPEKFVVIFPGSRSKHRIWPAAYFAEVAQYCLQNYGYGIVICGGNADKIYAEAIKKIFSGTVTDFTGATRLPELLTVLHRAEVLITVDTGSVHLAAAVECKVLGIYNGSQYGRFAPYPNELAPHVVAIYPETIQQDLQDPKIIASKYTYTVSIPYHSVQPSQVIQHLKRILQ
ncbi:MAG: lipopolysaccharide heptosyltransferase family protein [Chitinophagia bacterium]|nr:lipopolysaccharide heptosyltransferase family protein [Chitinophagia bacterium]